MSDQEHSMKCNSCGKMFDMRDLSEVFHHAFDGCLEGDSPVDVPFSSSRKVGEPVEYTKDKKAINLN